MPNSLTATGITTSSQAELLANQTANLQAIYGTDIDLSSNTPDGQAVNINIQAQIDVQELAVQIYTSFDPDQAVGTQLDQRCAINGVKRQAGTYSTTSINLVLTQSVNLYGLDQNIQPVYTVSDNIGNLWNLQQTQLGVGPGTVIYSFQAATPGANITIPNTINVPVTIVLGVQSINNPTSQSIVGINEETDPSLRIRRQSSVSISSQGYLQGLLGALENINGVASALVYENNGGTIDANGVPGHSIWVIIDGTPTISPVNAWSSITIYSYGQIVTYAGINYISWKNNNLNNAVTNTFYWGVYNPIAQNIYAKRNAGCGMYGQTSYTITQIDNNQFVVLWDFVAEQNLYISFTATSINSLNQPNIRGIISSLVANYKFSVAEEININQMATIVQQADPNCLVTNAGLSLSLTQIANLSGVAASGTFQFSYNGNNSSAINWNDAVGTIQTKLQAITGLSNATVSGSIASQILTITLNVLSSASLITVINNSIITSGSVPVSFSFNEGYSSILSPTLKKDKFILSAENIIILPMILSPTISTLSSLATLQLTGLGGYGNQYPSVPVTNNLIYSMQSNPSGGTINSQTGLYTAGAGIGTDIAKVKDAFGNTATATILVTV